MEITEKELEDGTVVLGLSGRLDPTTVATLEDRLSQAVAGGAKNVILDLAALDYISSAGLRVLLVGAKQLKGKQGTLALCAARRTVKEVLNIAGFSSIMKVFETEQDAVEGLGK